ncbi:hypothetical protein NEMIN01_2390 [Nematocida minor]|uniref:uncharacterized protein n=1 Tax=Nematocida minor TaxID=1912983 RepID=UPI00221EE7F5|nr:uncharacterized protein NEMIN01_2390 [Nematocida minor]KAI5193061.1 hypothetical protein NEMIN01_2390 [Nematocida minor]
MTYISTQKPDSPAPQSMSLEELKQGLLDLAIERTESIAHSELVKILTTVGNRLTLFEANQVLSLIPAKNGIIEISALISALEETSE